MQSGSVSQLQQNMNCCFYQVDRSAVGERLGSWQKQLVKGRTCARCHRRLWFGWWVVLHAIMLNVLCVLLLQRQTSCRFLEYPANAGHSFQLCPCTCCRLVCLWWCRLLHSGRVSSMASIKQSSTSTLHFCSVVGFTLYSVLAPAAMGVILCWLVGVLSAASTTPVAIQEVIGSCTPCQEPRSLQLQQVASIVVFTWPVPGKAGMLRTRMLPVCARACPGVLSWLLLSPALG